MAFRPTPDPEVVPLLRAIRARIEGLGLVTPSPKDGLELYLRNDIPFLQLEIRREHMSLDLWLPADKLDEARASGIARAHPFLGEEAVKVRFERAEDLSKVARWLEASYDYAPERGKAPPKPPKVQDAPIATPPPPATRGRAREREAPEAASGAAPPPPKKKAASSSRLPASGASSAKKPVAPAKKKAAKSKAVKAKTVAGRRKAVKAKATTGARSAVAASPRSPVAAKKKKAARKAPAARSTRAKATPRRKKA